MGDLQAPLLTIGRTEGQPLISQIIDLRSKASRQTQAKKRARTAAAHEAKHLKTNSGESGGSPSHNNDPPPGNGHKAKEKTTQEEGRGKGGLKPPPSPPPGGREAVPPYPSGTPGAEGLLERVPPPFGSKYLGYIKSALSGRTEGWYLPGSDAGSKYTHCQAGKKSSYVPLKGRTRELGEKFLRLKRAKMENRAATPQKISLYTCYRSKSITDYLQALTRITHALREALEADGLLGKVKGKVARIDEAEGKEASISTLSLLEAELKSIQIRINTLVGIHVPADVVPALKSLLDEYALTLSSK